MSTPTIRNLEEYRQYDNPSPADISFQNLPKVPNEVTAELTALAANETLSGEAAQGKISVLRAFDNAFTARVMGAKAAARLPDDTLGVLPNNAYAIIEKEARVGLAVVIKTRDILDPFLRETRNKTQTQSVRDSVAVIKEDLDDLRIIINTLRDHIGDLKEITTDIFARRVPMTQAGGNRRQDARAARDEREAEAPLKTYDYGDYHVQKWLADGNGFDDSKNDVDEFLRQLFDKIDNVNAAAWVRKEVTPEGTIRNVVDSLANTSGDLQSTKQKFLNFRDSMPTIRDDPKLKTLLRHDRNDTHRPNFWGSKVSEQLRDWSDFFMWCFKDGLSPITRQKRYQQYVDGLKTSGWAAPDESKATDSPRKVADRLESLARDTDMSPIRYKVELRKQLEDFSDIVYHRFGVFVFNHMRTHIVASGKAETFELAIQFAEAGYILHLEGNGAEARLKSLSNRGGALAPRSQVFGGSNRNRNREHFNHMSGQEVNHAGGTATAAGGVTTPVFQQSTPATLAVVENDEDADTDSELDGPTYNEGLFRMQSGNNRVLRFPRKCWVCGGGHLAYRCDNPDNLTEAQINEKMAFGKEQMKKHGSQQRKDKAGLHKNVAQTDRLNSMTYMYDETSGTHFRMGGGY